MIKNFDSFYFLHIPKTAGRLYVFNFLEPIYDDIEKSNINNIKDRINTSDHSQWRSEITDSTYVTTIFRDPCKQLVSLYVHGLTISEFNAIKDTSGITIDRQSFLSWIKKHEQEIKNYQSKNLMFSTVQAEENFFTKFKDNSFITKENVLNRINKISLILKPEILSENNIKIIQNAIMSDLGIKQFQANNKKYQREMYRNMHSEFVYNSLTNKDKEYVLSLSNIDSEIYETKKIFFSL
jgi:predicted DNA-binding protein YlxM (UPF0122 family)